ncbi:uncharacterized protein LOC142171949 [Nicotiana tabacum]|uniref:Uncharacterized protein LOC142171949 n=1 Tax=Nicotiana tabacum TaxID=4097 RepID=A0AC58T3K4_TOBAC
MGLALSLLWMLSSTGSGTSAIIWYETVNGTKVFEIKRELASTYQGTLDIASYFNKLKKLWDELGVMCTSHANSCVCAAKEDEKQRQVVPNTQFNSELASFNANSNINRFPSQLSSTKQYTQRVKFDSSNQKSNTTLSCKYCKKPGHTIEKCYKLYGFSSNFKFTKGKRSGTAASAEGQISESSALYSPTDQSSLIHGLTKEQYSQLMQLLNQSTLGDSGTQPILMDLPILLCSWKGLNSGFRTSNKDLLFNITPLLVPYLFSLPNGYKVKVHSMKKLLELGRMDQGLYKFHFNHFTPSMSPDNSVPPFNNLVHNAEFSLHTNVKNVSHSSACTLPCGTVQNVQTVNPCYVFTLPSCTVPNNVNKNDVLWHHRLGHVPFVQMKHISFISNDLSAKQPFICPICPLARQPRLSFPDSSSFSTSLFQLIHVDTWGPYHTQTYSRAKYFLTIVDDYSRATWTYLLHSKSYAFTFLKAFIAMIKTQFHLSVQKVRSDNALELGFSNSAIQFFSDNDPPLPTSQILDTPDAPTSVHTTASPPTPTYPTVSIESTGSMVNGIWTGASILRSDCFE